MTKHHGSCHCGAVQFDVVGDLAAATRCNCSICTKTMWTGLMGKPAQFTLVRGEDALGSYAWGHKVSTRFFCKHCGVVCFGKGHLAELGGDFVSVNVNALDGVDPHSIPLRHWDGRHDNWGASPRDRPWPME